MARIRTIKPEFWSHPVLSRQDDATKLMAISLLNFADDEGYFHAEPNVVRGFCRPFDDDSTITRKCLDNLSKISYISISENEFYGLVGRVESFLEHQKIDRPTASKLKQYYSTKTRRKFDDASSPEGKGTGKGTGNREFKNPKPIKHKKEFIPPTLDDVKEYFKSNGYKEETAIRMFRSYSEGNWIDSKGNPVLNWKQKAINVWFKDDNKIHTNRSTKLA